MISVGSRDGRKGLGLGLELEIEETELEEGEAVCHTRDDVDEDSTIDPDIALSYIEEKLQNVLGHFQKDFEGGVSAENLGAKFGGYGSFLPTYQRTPSWSLTKSPPEIHEHNRARSPRKLHLEDPSQNLVAASSDSLSAKPRAASGRTKSMGNSLKDDVHLPARHAEESTSKCELVKHSVDPTDQKTLKFRIKVGSENLLAQKNAEIYSGLGLVVSPSSSLDDSPTTSEGLCGVPKESPTSILQLVQIMTSFPSCLILSPLSEDLIHLAEKENLGEKSEFKSMDKTLIHISKSPVNGSLSTRSNQKVQELKNNADQNRIGSSPEKETNINSLGCEGHAIVVPVSAGEDEVKGETFSIMKKEYLGSVPAQDICKVEKLGGRLGSSGKVSESRKENPVSNTAAGTQKDILKAENAYASDQSESNVSKVKKSQRAEANDPPKQLVVQKGVSGGEEGLKVDLQKPSLWGKKKQKVVHCVDTQGAYVPRETPKSGKSSQVNTLMPKYDSHDLQNDHEKPGDRYKDFFGELGFEDEYNESISGEMTSSERLKDPHLVGNRITSEYQTAAKEKCNGKSAEKPYHQEKYPRVAPPLGNGQTSDPPTGTAPLDKEDWVSCDKCQTWRLLPLGTNPKSLPDKWICKMLSWLPGMNRCSIPEEETTNALRALYHPVASVAAPLSESQNNRFNNSVGKPVGVPLVDTRFPGQENLNTLIQTETISGEERLGSTHALISIALDGHTQSSNLQKKNLQASGRHTNPDRGNHSPSADASGYQHLRQSSSAVDKHNNNKKDKKISSANFSDGGTNSKIRNKRESDLDDSRDSKRIKSDHEKWISDNGGAALQAGPSSTCSLSNDISENDWRKHTNYKKKKSAVQGVNPEVHIAGTSDNCLLHPIKGDNNESVRKKTAKEHHGSQIRTEPLSKSGSHHKDSIDFVEESDRRKERKARVSKFGTKDTSRSKSSVGTERKDSNTKDQHNGQYMSNTMSKCSLDVADYLKTDMGSVQPSVAANSSCSKVSDSRKNKFSAQEVKGSPVESVSSSPLRFSHVDKFTSIRNNLVGKDDIHDSGSLAAISPRRLSGGEDGGNDQTGMLKKHSVLTHCDHATDTYDGSLYQANRHSWEKHSKQCQDEVKTNANQSQSSGSHSKKSGNELSSHFKDKTRTSGSDTDRVDMQACDFSLESLDHMHSHEEKSKRTKNKFVEKSGTPCKAEKNSICNKDAAGGTLGDSNKGERQLQLGGHHIKDAIKSQDNAHNLQLKHDNEKLPKKSHRAEVHGSRNSHSLPPLARVQTETVDSLQPVSGSQKENGVKILAVDGFENDGAIIALNQSRSSENQNGQPISLKHPTPNTHKVRNVEASSPNRKDSSSHAANNAIKEAKDLKHLADRLKNSGSTESIGLYFQASLKFLHGASLFESKNGEGIKYGEMALSMNIYSSTAKLCEFCAHEYEKSKDMASAALAYKCMEVAYMRVTYSSNISASRDWNELQTALQIVPLGESPSSSASDLDNLNNQATTDKGALTKVGSPQVSGSHIIASRNRSGLSRLLNFAQDINFAMEASRKSRIAFAAATSRLGETQNREGILLLRKALDFHFHDVEGLLRLVRVAMEAIGR